MNKTITNPIIKDKVTFVQTCAATNGSNTTLHVTVMPGGGTPLHYHKKFSETFIVEEGELTITLEGRTFTLFAGQKVTVDKGLMHRFSNESSMPVVFTTIVLPGSQGFENALQIMYGLAGDQKTDSKGVPKSLMALAVVSEISDMRLGGAGAAAAPLFLLLSFISKVTGFQKKLIAQYCN